VIFSKSQKNAQINLQDTILCNFEIGSDASKSKLDIKKDFFATEFSHETNYYKIWNMISYPNNEEKIIFEKIKSSFLRSFEIH
jgi:hypothetical protein